MFKRLGEVIFSITVITNECAWIERQWLTKIWWYFEICVYPVKRNCMFQNMLLLACIHLWYSTLLGDPIFHLGDHGDHAVDVVTRRRNLNVLKRVSKWGYILQVFSNLRPRFSACFLANLQNLFCCCCFI